MDLKSFRICVFLILFAGIMTGCNNDWSTSADPTQKQLIKSSSELRPDRQEFSPARKDKVRDRISRNLEYVRKKTLFLEEESSDHIEKISAYGRARSEQLRSDLVRIEKDLRNRLDDLDKSFWQDLSNSRDSFSSDIDHIEDELEQIDEQIDEWYENNIK